MSEKREHRPVAERREQLTRAAMDVMRRDGAWAVSTRSIAAEAGVPLGAVHYAFDSKAELVASVLTADLDETTRSVDEVADAGGDLTQVLATMLGTLSASLPTDHRTELVLQELTLMGVRDAELGPLSAQAWQGYRTQLAGFLDRVAAERELCWAEPSEVLAEMVLAQVVGLGQGWLSTGREDLLQAGHRVLARMLAGLARPV